MKHSAWFLALFLTLQFIVICNDAAAQPAYGTHIDWWSDLWLGQNSSGGFGLANDHCRNDLPDIPMEYPDLSGQQYFHSMDLWIGAIIDSQGFLDTRVSLSNDGWLNPAITEFWPTDSIPFTERTRLWRYDACGNLVYSPQAIADHEIETVISDTLTDPFWVAEDPIDGPHRPLGLKITRTTYSSLDILCLQHQVVRYHIENIGTNILRDIYIGHYLQSSVIRRDLGNSADRFDDFVSYYPQAGMMYTHDDDGWLHDDSSRENFVLPHALGFVYLQPLQPHQRISFNWWYSNGDVSLDFGPAWSEYATNPQSPLFWTRTLGTPLGDLRKYQIMSNQERDWDLLRIFTNDSSYSDDGQSWYPDPFGMDLITPGTTSNMLSIGPLGNVEGTHTVLHPGESFDLWCAFVMGRDFHNRDYPQQPNDLDPRRYDLTDLLEQVNRVRSGECLNWLASDDPVTPSVPTEFSLSAVYPNPFNASAEFDLSIAETQFVTVAVFDIMGRRVETIIEQSLAPGVHHLHWNATNAASGVHFITAQSERGQTHLQKAVLLK